MWQHFHIGDMRKVTEGHLRLDIWVTTGKAHKKVRFSSLQNSWNDLWDENIVISECSINIIYV